MSAVERDLFERLVATLENVLLHHQRNMPEVDATQRWKLVFDANKLLSGRSAE